MTFRLLIISSILMSMFSACNRVKPSISVQLAAGDRTTRITDITPSYPKAGETVILTGKRFPTRTKNLIGRVVLRDGSTKDGVLTVASETSASFTVPTDAASDVKSIIMLTTEKTFATYEIKLAATPTSGAPVLECSPDCYSGAQDLAVDEMRLGPGGTVMILQHADGNSGFKIWKEKDGSRILNASGDVTKGWQQTLTRNGVGFSGADLTSADHIALIAGRVCPANVFLDYNFMTAGGRCLYYDSGMDLGHLADTCVDSELGEVDLNLCTGTEAEDYLAAWDRANSGQGTNASYYEGNIKICADRGMRLPTVYELATTATTVNLPTGDGLSTTPSWAGASNGVPMVANTNNMWTASANTSYSWTYFIWGGASIGVDSFNATNNVYSVRCVLPNN